MLKISIHGFSAIGQTEIQTMLLQLVVDRHGWVIEESSPSASCVYRLRFEFALFDIVEVYGALQQTGIHFTPQTHRALTEMCLCQKHSTDWKEVRNVSVDLQVTTREEVRGYFQRFVRWHTV